LEIEGAPAGYGVRELDAHCHGHGSQAGVTTGARPDAPEMPLRAEILEPTSYSKSNKAKMAENAAHIPPCSALQTLLAPHSERSSRHHDCEAED